MTTTTDTPEALREWLRENLVISVEAGPDFSVFVGLKFKGEAAPFCYESLHIPSPEDA